MKQLSWQFCEFNTNSVTTTCQLWRTSLFRSWCRHRKPLRIQWSLWRGGTLSPSRPNTDRPFLITKKLGYQKSDHWRQSKTRAAQRVRCICSFGTLWTQGFFLRKELVRLNWKVKNCHNRTFWFDLTSFFLHLLLKWKSSLEAYEAAANKKGYHGILGQTLNDAPFFYLHDI